MFSPVASLRARCLPGHMRLAQMTAHFSSGATSGARHSLRELPKSSVFTDNLPSDAAFPTPAESHKAPREALGPRLVRDAAYSYVRPEGGHENAELLAVSEAALRDLGIKEEDVRTNEFKEVVSGNKILTWDEEREEGIYPWAQCYGGYQFGQWAGQLGDGRAISLFEVTNPDTKVRYELQLKGAGKTPYARFADGKAVFRSSLREFIVSEALNALKIPTTRALSLTLLPEARVLRERIEPGAIVTRFAQSWIRLGTLDLPRARGDRKLLRKLVNYIGENVLGGWGALPAKLSSGEINETAQSPEHNVPADKLQGEGKEAENRFARLYREIVRRNAKTVAAWQAYGFMNGVLNTDNTSVMGLSIDFGPFAFMDNFDPTYTPNHDDHMLRYSYRNQPTIIWWNLVRLGEAMGELIGAGARCDDEEFIDKGVRKDWANELVERAEHLIEATGEEYKAVFMAEYKRLMTARLGLKTFRPQDFDELFSEWLDTMEALELDFNQCFRKLSAMKLARLEGAEARKEAAKVFFHKEGVAGNEDEAKERLAKWLDKWRSRTVEDWGDDKEEERMAAMKSVNPKFIPKSWVLDDIIQRVEKKGEREVLDGVMKMTLSPFEDRWGWSEGEEERFCGDVPKYDRAMQCSCSS
ncbi:YdiU domain protein [Lineolata rhizophorae]|uniref:Selenoprotein O n=1 Tax=Lineolata rhizophorae TaxID=578093 RepID=A0A6A6PBI9_9PEZI|nr:YdiU domain protein [Lineolata rhizophorae]